jgi:3-phosphoshikimate 1-carboxyvinyltransferase
MSSRITIRRPERPIDVIIDLPRSKSVANRVLILASLAGDPQCVKDIGTADDTRILRNLLRDRPRVMHCGAGGTTFRFLLAWAAVQVGKEHIITGDARLLQRPHGPLIDALRAVGADISEMEQGYRVLGRKLLGGSVVMNTPMSSQYISALLLIAPTMEVGLTLHWTGQRFSEPYVRMTLMALAHFGVFPTVDADAVRVKPQRLKPNILHVPPDWSAAAFWYEVAALSKDARMAFPGLMLDEWQGDRAAAMLWNGWVRTDTTPKGLVIRSRPSVEAGSPQLFETGSPAGDPARPPLSFNLRNTPDLFQALVFSCAGRGTSAAFTGVDNLPLKETDRIAAVEESLARIGVLDSSFIGGQFSITLADGPTEQSGDEPLETFGDHRMAMSLAPLALVFGSITLHDPDVVSKSYPAFWEDLRRAGFGVG